MRGREEDERQIDGGRDPAGAYEVKVRPVSVQHDEVRDDGAIDDRPQRRCYEERSRKHERDVRAGELDACEPGQAHPHEEADGKREWQGHGATLIAWANRRRVDEARITELLLRLQSGGMQVAEAVAALRQLPFADLGFAVVDHHRALRQGVPEVILGEGKTPEQVIAIARELARTGQNVLVTRIDDAKAAALLREIPEMRHNALARTCTLELAPTPLLSEQKIALVSAGTSDMPVAEECAETMRMLGLGFERIFDVGVAGIHRLLSKRSQLESAALVIVIAGMEGALASVVGGLVDVPVIAVPTSVGYGVAQQGMTALFGMLTSCASGITVVNIDNGFGAAFAAARIMRQRKKGTP